VRRVYFHKPKARTVRLDGARIISTSIGFCAEGLNDSGEVVFTVDVEDNTRLEGFRSAIYLATPKKRLQ
jgi:hypothetical protein